MIHSLYVHREKGEKLLLADQRAMKEAEHLLFQEFAFVLKLDENEVESFIEERLNK